MSFISHADVYLNQDRIWADRQRRRYLIAKMGPDHARNSAAMLVRKAELIARMSLARFVSDMKEMGKLPDPAEFGDATSDFLERENDIIMEEIVSRTDSEWVQTLPLYRALCARARMPY